MEMSVRTHFSFPVGYHAFHRKQLFNFQLNRWYSLGYLTYDAMVAAGKKVSNFATWRGEMRTLAEGALRRGELIQAAFYYRAEEVYAIPPHEREALYKQFAELFYLAFATGDIEEAYNPRALLDNDGQFLNGAKHRYVLRLSKEDMSLARYF